jgi:hypothetical protein
MPHQARCAALAETQRRVTATGECLSGCIAPVHDGMFASLLATLDQVPATVSGPLREPQVARR